jgi:hypothetical protein
MADRMKRRQEPQVVAMWCLVAAIGIIAVAVALITISKGR